MIALSKMEESSSDAVDIGSQADSCEQNGDRGDCGYLEMDKYEPLRRLLKDSGRNGMPEVLHFFLSVYIHPRLPCQLLSLHVLQAVPFIGIG